MLLYHFGDTLKMSILYYNPPGQIIYLHPYSPVRNVFDLKFFPSLRRREGKVP